MLMEPLCLCWDYVTLSQRFLSPVNCEDQYWDMIRQATVLIATASGSVQCSSAQAACPQGVVGLGNQRLSPQLQDCGGAYMSALYLTSSPLVTTGGQRLIKLQVIN